MILHNLSIKDQKKYKNLDLSEKIKLSKDAIKKASNEIDWNHSAIAWTGGKDSTLLLWLIKQVAEERDWKIPKIMFVDEGDVFNEIWEFIDKISKEWKFSYSIAHNQDVSLKAKKLGDMIKVSDLNDRNRREIERLGFTEKEFPFEPESFVGNHLMKTVATNFWIEENKIKALFVGVRWDEQSARAEDDFLRKIDKPRHFRVEPILHFTEKDVWDATHKFNIPFVKLYEQGYRSLGARVTTKKTDDKPAWQQDLEGTQERGGRRQDKEQIMKRLRDLGYM